MQQKPVHRVIDLVEPGSQQLLDLTPHEACARLLTGPPAAALGIRGSFALVAREDDRVVMARSLDRPLRFFLAKEPAGPMLVVAERIDAIRDCLVAEGYGHQFHPSYTRMVPAHHVTTLRLIGCPDPQPTHARFFAPAMATLPADLDTIGEHYVGALLQVVREWLAALPADEPIGVLFSGGADSTAVLLAVHHELLARGQSAASLKAFTLAVDGGGSDLAQARSVLDALGLGFLLEVLEVPSSAVDPWRAVEVIEDYRPLDVQCAAVGLALLEALRARYPQWRHLADGDGGDENLKDYPIEEDSELTIRSVVNNRMLYQEGWGVAALKHSSTYSGGHSRGCVRGWAPARRFGFLPFSPFTRPEVIAVAEAIPFASLAAGSHERLYALKGEVLSRGLRRHLGVEVPMPPKRRFQHGAGGEALAVRLAHPEALYRAHFATISA
ncbi:MAG TPA: asparagine synthase-related protein [Thermoanaerobaculia bacterium]|jgi:asparagine synthase (glutamine-hydrolysing)|nr:asparagine synthase-related protein [Thermoanaerobaculia bacterium]